MHPLAWPCKSSNAYRTLIHCGRPPGLLGQRPRSFAMLGKRTGVLTSRTTLVYKNSEHVKAGIRSTACSIVTIWQFSEGIEDSCSSLVVWCRKGDCEINEWMCYNMSSRCIHSHVPSAMKFSFRFARHQYLVRLMCRFTNVASLCARLRRM